MKPASKIYLELLRELQHRLEVAGKPAAESRWILGYAARLNEKQLAARLMQAIPADVEEAAWAMLNLRLTGYPLQLLLGETEFYGLKLKVERGVLIPRPETEGLVEHALGYVQMKAEARVLDVGSGSGAIALAFKSMRPKATVWATDISPKAIELARKNAGLLELEVTFLQASFTADLSDLDLIISNPPYLPDHYRAEAPPELAYEDAAALYSGPEGLDMAHELLPHAWKALKPGGWLLLELAPENVYTLLGEATAHGWREARVFRDLAQQPRFLACQKPSQTSPEPEDEDPGLLVWDNE
jgi:release factor glutamine methyltransferase